MHATSNHFPFSIEAPRPFICAAMLPSFPVRPDPSLFGRTETMIPLAGYADRLSVRPDETISFHVSNQLPSRKIEAELVRVMSADPHTQPGPGIQLENLPKESTQITCLQEPGPNRTQLGSHAEIPLPPNFVGVDCGFTFVVNIFPTHFGTQPQSIASIKSLFDLYLDERGTLRLIVVGKWTSVHTSAPSLLPVGKWAQVGFTIDAASKTISVDWKMLDGSSKKGCDYVFFEDGKPFSSASSSEAMLIFGASQRSEAGSVAFVNHFNGRMENPRLWKRPLDLLSVFLDERSIPTTSSVTSPDASWDFGLEMMTQIVRETGTHGLHGNLVNFPTRAVRGSNWSGREMCWRHAPQEYAAIHFHASDFGDCQWPVCYQWKVPTGLKSGNYALVLKSQGKGSGFTENVPFFVVAPRAKPQADVVLIIPTFTYVIYGNHARPEWHSDKQWRAAWKDAANQIEGAYPYNPGGHPDYGLSTYNNHVDGYGVSLTTWRRPMLNLRVGYITFPYPDKHGSGLRHYPADSHLMVWLEKLGLAYDVVTDWELHREGGEVLKPYRVVLTGTHPEYHTEESWNAIKDYRDSGGRLCYLGGNGFYWKIAVNEENGVMEIRRGEGGIRAWASEPGEYYHQLDGAYGGLWRRSGRPPQVLTGVGFTAQGNFVGSYYRIRQSARQDPRTAWMLAGISEELIGQDGLSADCQTWMAC